MIGMGLEIEPAKNQGFGSTVAPVLAVLIVGSHGGGPTMQTGTPWELSTITRCERPTSAKLKRRVILVDEDTGALDIPSQASEGQAMEIAYTAAPRTALEVDQLDAGLPLFPIQIAGQVRARVYDAGPLTPMPFAFDDE